MKTKEDLKDLVYELATGTRNLAEYPVKESRYVANEFAEGAPCAIKYKEIYEIGNRLCERLGVTNDSDVDMLMDNFLEILEVISKKMFDYGMFFKDNPAESESAAEQQRRKSV